jgi:arabinofuranan 3-O-arabinosyltransferase
VTSGTAVVLGLGTRANLNRLGCRSLVARLRRGTIPLALAAIGLALALVQRPGESATDTKIDLHAIPVRFLGEITSLWSSSSGLGGVETAQYAGYLFPMGPFFALGHLAGLPDWLVDRLWIALVLALAAWGVVRLSDAWFGQPRGVAHAVAGLTYLLNPYVVVFVNRTTVTLLAYAALPWLLLIVHRGVREGGWRMPAAFALVVTASGGGVNAAVVAFVLLGPLLLLLYEPLSGGPGWRASASFAWRSALLALVASLWWIAPIAAQVAYGIDFLKFTEPAGAIWSTTSLTESLRLMGYWIAYIGVGYDGVVRPYFSDAGYLLFDVPVLLATLVVPALALWGFAWTRPRRHAPFLLGLVLIGAFLMTTGFPDGTPLRRGVTWAYNHVESVRFMRTTYKAGPLVALGLAGLAGLAAAELARPLRGRSVLRVALVTAAGALVALSAWPLVRGRAIDSQVTWKRIPPAWKDVARDLDRTLRADQRAIVLPGNLYAFYDWGGTVDPILPTLAKRPVAERNAVPYGDLHGIDLLWTTDALVQQERAVPGELASLLRLMGAGQVVVGTDDDHFRSGAADPAAAARALDGQGFTEPVAEYGPRARFAAPAGDLGPSPILAQVRRYEVAAARPLVRVEPVRPTAVVDGSAAGVASLAAFGALRRRGFEYAGDLDPPALRAAARAGAGVVVTDSNRRRVFAVSRMRQNNGATLAADDPISEDAAVLNPFPGRGSAGQTVAVLHGARYLRAPFSPGYSQFPERRPYAALDRNPRTFWAADAALDPKRQWIEIGFVKPLDIPYVDVLPRSDAGARPVAVVVTGRTLPLHGGWNRLRLGLRDAGSLRLLLKARSSGTTSAASSGGFAEIRIPGVRVTQSLRPPTLAEQALRRADLSHSELTYLFERTTGDRPFRRGSATGSSPIRHVHDPDRLEAARLRDPGDGERLVDRVFTPPAARSWSADAWVTVAADARDSRLDRLAGYRGGVRVDSSGRFQGRPAFRGSAAFDGSPARPWIGRLAPGERAWLRWTTPSVHTLRELTLVAPPQRIRAPTRVELRWPGGRSGPLRVGSGGRVVLPRPVAARSFELSILASAFPAGTSERERLRAGVAIGELRGAGVPRIAAPATRVRSGCGAVAAVAGAARLLMAVGAPRNSFESGAPLRARACGRTARLPAGRVRLRSGGADFSPYLLRLRSPAPRPRTAPLVPGRVVGEGRAQRAGRTGVELALTQPATLVLGEGYSSGWRAYCDGDSLGAPRVVDGYANGWTVTPSCRSVRFAFAPSGRTHVLQIAAALACLLMLVLLVLRRPRRAAVAAAAPRDHWPDVVVPRTSMRRALALGLLAGAVLGFCFSLRSGVAITAGVSAIVWLGIGPRLLALVGGALLALVVPVLYVAFQAEDKGGYNPGYAGDHVAAHWVAVAAFVLLLVALVQTLTSARVSSASLAAPAAGPAAGSAPPARRPR